MPKRLAKQLESSKKLAKLLSKNDSNEVSAAELRHNTAAIVSRVAVSGERLILTRNRKKVAALVPMSDFDLIRKTRRG